MRLKSTTNGRLNVIPDCYVTIPVTSASSSNSNSGIQTRSSTFAQTIEMRSLPDISDSKSANYSTENIMGRSFPLYTYSHSGDRTISMQIHFFIVEDGDAERNINSLRLLQSAVYPRQGSGGAPYMPPCVCTIKCGKLLGDQPLCCALQSYSVKFPPDVAWWNNPDGMYCPYRFDVDTTWLTVYTSSDLPYQDRIVQSGR